MSAAELDSTACRYVAREVLNDDRRSLAKADVFALGASLYELACNTRLPEGAQAPLSDLVHVFGLLRRPCPRSCLGGDCQCHLQTGPWRPSPGAEPKSLLEQAATLTRPYERASWRCFPPSATPSRRFYRR